MVRNNELEPCPFCGREAEFVTNSSGFSNESRLIGFYIKCKGCHIKSPKNYELRVSLGCNGLLVTDYDQRDEAINDWNTRSGGKE